MNNTKLASKIIRGLKGYREQLKTASKLDKAVEFIRHVIEEKECFITRFEDSPYNTEHIDGTIEDTKTEQKVYQYILSVLKKEK